MKTMRRTTLKGMRVIVECMLTRVQKWEDRSSDSLRPDYRVTSIIGGLYQASQHMAAMIEGDYQPVLREALLRTRLKDLPGAQVGEQYERELLEHAPVPLWPVD